jgi:FixJ family two-component response regulator
VAEEREALVHIVDDDESMRTALKRLLERSGYAVKTYSSAGDFLVAEPDDTPGCMLLDLSLPGPNGLELQKAMHRQSRVMPIVFMSAYADIPQTVRAMRGGASDFLVKPFDDHTLLAAIESAVAAFAAIAADEGHREFVAPALTERELTVLRGVVAGRLNKQLAFDLHLSERTIKTCRAEVMRKFGAHSLVDLVRLAAPLVGG